MDLGRQARHPRAGRRRAALLGFAAACSILTACAESNKVPAGTREPDKFLFERGSALLQDKKWLTAREMLRQLVENFPQSPYRPDAKLGVADSFLGEGSTASVVLAINEYREFLTFYPTNQRADYAQYKLGYCHFKQMLAPQRDQSETREAVKEFETFVQRYPNSALMGEVKARLRDARDRFSDSEYNVGYFYFRARWFPGAVDRFKSILKNDPEYTRRDGVYFYLAEALLKTDKKAEALPYYERLITEFVQSEYLEDAHKRVDELKPALAPTTTSRPE